MRNAVLNYYHSRAISTRAERETGRERTLNVSRRAESVDSREAQPDGSWRAMPEKGGRRDDMSTEGNRQAIRGERLKDAEVQTDERIQQYQKYSSAAVPVQRCNSSTAAVNCTPGDL